MGADVPVKEAAKSALQKSQVLLNKAKQLENDLRGILNYAQFLNIYRFFKDSFRW